MLLSQEKIRRKLKSITSVFSSDSIQLSEYIYIPNFVTEEAVPGKEVN